MKTYHLPVIVEIDEDNVFIVSCPAFEACHTYGKTINDAMENLKEVIEICVAEEPSESVNTFIGIREIEFQIPASA